MLTEEQHAARSRAIGGSDAAAACGMDPWKSRLELYLEKIKPIEERPATGGRMSPRMLWGQLLEPVVREHYTTVTGRRVTVPDTIYHPKFPFILVHADGVTDDNRGLEIKTTRLDEGWGEPGTDQIPEHYLFQTHHTMMVTGLAVVDVAVLIAGSDFRLYTVEADADFQEDLLDAEREFWGHVERREPPEPEYGKERTTQMIRKLYAGTTGAVITASEEDEHYKRTFENAALHAKTYGMMAEYAKQHLEWSLAEGSMLRFPDGTALRRRLVKRAGYTVEPTESMDVRFVNYKE